MCVCWLLLAYLSDDVINDVNTYLLNEGIDFTTNMYTHAMCT